jgi:hypothetical protein
MTAKYISKIINTFNAGARLFYHFGKVIGRKTKSCSLVEKKLGYRPDKIYKARA